MFEPADFGAIKESVDWLLDCRSRQSNMARVPNHRYQQEAYQIAILLNDRRLELPAGIANRVAESQGGDGIHIEIKETSRKEICRAKQNQHKV